MSKVKKIPSLKNEVSEYLEKINHRKFNNCQKIYKKNFKKV